MKRFLFSLLATLFSCVIMLGASNVIYLKNGSIIKGEILEEVPGESIKIKTSDGNIWVYKMDEIEKITKNEPNIVGVDNPKNCNLKHRGLDFEISTGYNIYTKGNSGSIPVELMLSKRFSPYFSGGISAGVDLGLSEGSKPLIPLAIDFRGFLPLSSTIITPFADVKIGYSLNTAEDTRIGSGKNTVYISQPDYITFSIMPGVRFPLSRVTDLDLGIGYRHFILTKGSGGFGEVAFNVGFNFHRPLGEIAKKEKVYVPTRDNGFQLGIEFSGISAWGPNLTLGYKCNPKLSLALGVGTGYMSFSRKPGTWTLYSGQDGEGNEVASEETTDYSSTGTPVFLFLRGRYKFTDTRLSPFVSLDLGYRWNNADSEEYYWTVQTQSNGDKSVSSGGIFFRPQVGVTYRVTNNSYIYAAVGVGITNGISSLNEVTNKSGTWDRKQYRSQRVEIPGKNFTNFAFTIGWERTFGLFSK